MDSRIEGLSSTVLGVQNCLDDHGALLKSHSLDLQGMKAVLDKLIVGQEKLTAAHEQISDAQARFVVAQSRVADELLALLEGAVGSSRRGPSWVALVLLVVRRIRPRGWGALFDGRNSLHAGLSFRSMTAPTLMSGLTGRIVSSTCIDCRRRSS